MGVLACPVAPTRVRSNRSKPANKGTVGFKYTITSTTGRHDNGPLGQGGRNRDTANNTRRRSECSGSVARQGSARLDQIRPNQLRAV